MSKSFEDEMKETFLVEAGYLIDQCEESFLKLENPEDRPEELSKIFRLAHSVKGAGASVGFTELSRFAHVLEDLLSVMRVHPQRIDAQSITLLLESNDALKEEIARLKEGNGGPWDVEDLKRRLKESTALLLGGTVPNAAPPPAAAPIAPVPSTATTMPTVSTVPAMAEPEAPAKTAAPNTEGDGEKPAGSEKGKNGTKVQATLKVETERVDNLLDLIGEIIVVKSQLINETRPFTTHPRLQSIVSLLDKTVRELQDKALGIRMTPLRSIFVKANRIARDLSVRLQKPVEFVSSGEDTEVDRMMVEMLSDPITHLIRNAIDHGLENPADRKASGKPEKGTLRMSAEQAGGRVLLKITDDGRGISRAKVIKKALENGLIENAERAQALSYEDVVSFIMKPGFSTAAEISDVSGRGVGLDVVSSNIEKLRGTFEIDSVEGSGTTFTISIPLTASITEGMLVDVQGRPYLIPMDHIREVIRNDSLRVTRLEHGRRYLHVRNQSLPIVDVANFMGGAQQGMDLTKARFVVLETSSRRYCLPVTEVLGDTQVVLKSLGGYFGSSPGISGAAILGDGRVALVLDGDGILRAGLPMKETDAAV